MTLKSGKVYSDIGPPSNTYGVDGDIYMQLDGLKTTYRKEGAVWVAVGSSLGAIPEFISGSGVPSNSLGEDGQYYRETSSQNIYYKQGGVWNIIGNLDNRSISAKLAQAGIGKDLLTPPNLINSGSLNTVTSVGEYYYEAGVSNKPTNSNGLLKVWREDEDYIYQIAHIGVTGKLSSRYSNDGGANWTSWFDYGRTQGYNDVDFHVSGGTDPNSAVSYGQLAALLLNNGDASGTSGNDRYFDIPVAADKAFRVVFNTYGGAASKGTVTFTNAFDVLIGVWPSPIYNANITDGNAVVTQIKVATNNDFQFSSGIESEGDDVFHAVSLSFYWVAVGLIDI